MSGLQCPHCGASIPDSRSWGEVALSTLMPAPAVPDMATQVRCDACGRIWAASDQRHLAADRFPVHGVVLAALAAAVAVWAGASVSSLLTLACLWCAIALVAARVQARPLARAAAKLGASTCFVLVAVSLNAWHTPYGQIVLGALALSWVGDALLLSRHASAFLSGLGAFLLAHVLYTAAFVVGGMPLDALVVPLLVALACGGAILRWLLPHVPAGFEWPVTAYVVTILVMCIAAAGHALTSGHWRVLGGAVLFAVSDIAVARERFVAPSGLDHRWGLPAYFAAQLLLAWSVADHP